MQRQDWSEDTIKRFDSPEAFADWIAPSKFGDGRTEDWYPSDFAGGTFKRCLANLNNGDLTHLDRAQKLIDKMPTDIFSEERYILAPSVAGYIPNIPAAISGHPEAMFHRHTIESPNLTAPIRIFIETTVSAGLSHDELINRGVATIALVLALNKYRPVELFTASLGYMGGKVYGVIVRVESKPLDMARAVYMLADPGYARQLAFTAMHTISDRNNFESIPLSLDRRDICQCEDSDILIKGGHLIDKLMLTNPVAWVTKMVEEHTAQVE